MGGFKWGMKEFLSMLFFWSARRLRSDTAWNFSGGALKSVFLFPISSRKTPKNSAIASWGWLVVVVRTTIAWWQKWWKYLRRINHLLWIKWIVWVGVFVTRGPDSEVSEIWKATFQQLVVCIIETQKPLHDMDSSLDTFLQWYCW